MRHTHLLMIAALIVAGCGSTAPSPVPPPGVPRPPMTYSLTGVVVAATGEPLAGVSFRAGSRNFTSDAAGRYAVVDLPDPLPIQVTKENYETQFVSARDSSRDTTLTLRLQPIIRVDPGGVTTVTFSTTDPRYEFDYYEECAFPCKLIRLTAPGAGSLTITVSARDGSRTVTVYTNGGSTSYSPANRVTIPVTFQAAGESVIYVTTAEGLMGGPDPRLDVSSSFRSR